MKKEYALDSFVFQGREYGPGMIRLDEERSEVELLRRKKSFRGEQLVSVTRFTYDMNTDVHRDGTSLRVAGASLAPQRPDTASELLRSFLSPLGEACERPVGQLKEGLRGLLLQRADAIGIAGDLRSDPRSALVQNSPLIPADAADPAKALLETLTGQLRDQLQEIQEALQTAPERVRARLTEMIYALTCALCAIQIARMEKKKNAEGNRDEEEEEAAPFQLISSITQFETVQQEGGQKKGASGDSALPPVVATHVDIAGEFLDAALANIKERLVRESAE